MGGKRQEKKAPTVKPARTLEQKERKRRLADALRANLRKRKDQKREQAHIGDERDKN